MDLTQLVPDLSSPEVQAFASGFPVTLAHAGITALLLFIGATLYALLTPYKEIALIREGNAAASVALLPAKQLHIHVSRHEGQPRDHPLEDGHERGPV